MSGFNATRYGQIQRNRFAMINGQRTDMRTGRTLNSRELSRGGIILRASEVRLLAQPDNPKAECAAIDQLGALVQGMRGQSPEAVQQNSRAMLGLLMGKTGDDLPHPIEEKELSPVVKLRQVLPGQEPTIRQLRIFCRLVSQDVCDQRPFLERTMMEKKAKKLAAEDMPDFPVWYSEIFRFEYLRILIGEWSAEQRIVSPYQAKHWELVGEITGNGLWLDDRKKIVNPVEVLDSSELRKLDTAFDKFRFGDRSVGENITGYILEEVSN